MDDDLSLNINKTDNHRLKPVVLLFLDGWGVDSVSEVNAIYNARPKNFFKLIKEYPVALLLDESRDPRRRYWSLGTGLDVSSYKYPSSSYSLTSILADNNLKQLKISPAYSFFYLNLSFKAYQEKIYLGEEIKLAEGKNKINDYLDDLKESFSFFQTALNSEFYDFIAISLPTADQLSLKVDFKKIVKGINYLDNYLKKISDLVLAKDGVLIIVSPFGNAEYTKDLSTDWLNREATNNPVPLILIANKYLGKTIGLSDPIDNDLSLLSPVAGLSSVLPTVLKIMNIDLPIDIKSKSLI